VEHYNTYKLAISLCTSMILICIPQVFYFKLYNLKWKFFIHFLFHSELFFYIFKCKIYNTKYLFKIIHAEIQRVMEVQVEIIEVQEGMTVAGSLPPPV